MSMVSQLCRNVLPSFKLTVISHVNVFPRHGYLNVTVSYCICIYCSNCQILKQKLLAFLDFHQPHVVAIQETKIDSSIATSRKFAHIVYIEKTETMVAGSCCSSIRAFRMCLSQNWKTTRNQFG